MHMFSAFIIVFREALEVALALTFVALGTASIVGRGAWIWLGLGLGVAGSILVAEFTDVITSSISGFGQEVFQGSVLTLSAILIVYTVVWMKRHASELTKSIKNTSAAVVAGEKPLFALSSIVALTVLRDGSEVVLLSQGLFVS